MNIQLAGVNDVKFNGTSVDKVNFNGTEVWRNGGLPSAYQEVEYVRFNGRQYVNTNIYPTLTQKLRIEGGVSTWIGSREMNVIGFNNGSKWQLEIFFYYTANTFVAFCGEHIKLTSSSSLYNRKIEYAVEVDDSQTQKLKFWLNNIDGGLYGESTVFTRREWNYQLTFNCSTGLGPDTLYADIYKHKIYLDNVLKGDLIPCKRKSDSVVGFYNIVNGEFLTNGGSGTLTAGPNV